MKEISDLRSKIEFIDKEIVQLVCRRQMLVKSLDLLKKYNKVPIRNIKIEQEKLASVRQQAMACSVDPLLAEDIMRLLINHAILYQTQTEI